METPTEQANKEVFKCPDDQNNLEGMKAPIHADTMPSSAAKKKDATIDNEEFNTPTEEWEIGDTNIAV
eukprot:81684-Prorocentrum_lima.AAC.1